jgi:hypothetical protein
MPACPGSRSLVLLGCVALFAGLTFTGEGRAQHKKPAPPAEKEKKLIKEEFKGKEGEVLKEVYILLSAANKDYEGHRGKAMHAIQEACKLLDESILKHGSVAQKIKAIQEDQVAAGAKALDKYNVPIREGQAVSDALLVRSGVVLKELAGVLAANKQPKTLSHVEHALKEIEIALAIR